jgi:hypothetical protein
LLTRWMLEVSHLLTITGVWKSRLMIADA